MHITGIDNDEDRSLNDRRKRKPDYRPEEGTTVQLTKNQRHAKSKAKHHPESRWTKTGNNWWEPETSETDDQAGRASDHQGYGSDGWHHVQSQSRPKQSWDT